MPFREPPKQRFERVANFRDMGGHTTRDGRNVKPGRLFRSGHLARASAADSKLLHDLGLQLILDLRTLSDIELEGADRVPGGAGYVRLPMPDPAKPLDIRAMLEESGPEVIEEVFGDGRAAEMMRNTSAALVRERIEPYSAFLGHLSREQAVPALFHCSAGKDRAGWAGTIVLLAVGVEEDEVIEQYLLSNREVDRIRKRLAGEWSESLRPLLEVRVEYLQSSFEVMHEDWGDFDHYLHEALGITEQQREQLRKNLLD